MDLSATQKEALEKIRTWIEDPNGKQVFKLMGYAGTGKTTIAKEVVPFVEGPVKFAAFTGKAASVLAKKGCTGAQTVHSLVYIVREKSRQELVEIEERFVELQEASKKYPEDQGLKDQAAVLEEKIKQLRQKLSGPSFSLNTNSELKETKLLCLDEVSMIDSTMGTDILCFEQRTLVLGDPAQLPPVFGSGYFIKGEPDVLLTDIHRQAKDNPLLWMANEVRQEKFLKPGTYGPNAVFAKGSKIGENVLNFDQILVGKNATRRWVNGRIRELLGYKEWHPIPGDKLICLRNNHDLGILNGTIWYVEDVGEVSPERIVLTLQDEDRAYSITTEIHGAPFRGEDIPYWERKEAEEFDFGYGITVHKAQGSQWDNVLLYDEAFCFRENKHKWLYTGLTRAAKRVTVLRT